MKRLFYCLPLFLCLLLSGCAVLDGQKVSITPHEVQVQPARTEGIAASSYLDLMEALAELVSSGMGEGVIDVAAYDPAAVDGGMAMAIRYIMEDHPIGSYAVEDVGYEVGTTGGKPALAVRISYDRTQSQIQRIRSMENLAEAEGAIVSALEGYDPGIVLLVDNYIETDIAQLVEDYALEHPRTIMEAPQVTVDVYGKGTRRVMEVGFGYRNSREDLRQMQEQVAPVFDAATLYVSGDGSSRQKYSQLYGFLMERFYYTVETSLTPSYSLLCHGVGDSRAFATVYAQMCRSAGLECLVVNGAYDGEPWTWNMIRIGQRYFHLDLLRCRAMGRYWQFTDGEMEGYVWDYSAYPEARDNEPEREEEDWAQQPAETTAPSESTEPSGSTAPSESTVPPETETTQPTDYPWYPWYPWYPETSEPTEPETSEPTVPTTEPEESTAPTRPSTPQETTQPTVPSESTAPGEEVTEPAEKAAETVPEET